ncbi:MAG: inorganic diphosphatase [Gemmatimonadaceae bacterium]
MDKESGCVNVVVETARGGRTKLAYDPERDVFAVKKVLPEGMSFPFDFGFIPSTQGEDGDPVDVLVLMDEPIATGTIVPCRLIGVIEAEQTEKNGESQENNRLVAVGSACVMYRDVKKLADLSSAVVEQIEHFFVSYNEQEGKRFRVTGKHGRKRAEACLDEGRRRFRREHPAAPSVRAHKRGRQAKTTAK